MSIELCPSSKRYLSVIMVIFRWSEPIFWPVPDSRVCFEEAWE